MAREEHQREDLMRDARAMVRRAEIELPPLPSLVMGKHPTGAASFFFGEDPVFHINSRGQLRRAYVAGRLYKAEGGELIEMERVRTPGQVELRSHTLSPSEREAFTTNVGHRLTDVVAHVDRGAYTLVAEVPAQSDVVDEIVAWLRPFLAGPLEIASTPHVG